MRARILSDPRCVVPRESKTDRPPPSASLFVRARRLRGEGDAGLIVPEGDAEAIAGALQRLHDEPNLRQALASKGRERVLQHFTHASVAQATVDVYRSLLPI